MGRQELIGDGANQLIPHYKAGEEKLVYMAHRESVDAAYGVAAEAQSQTQAARRQIAANQQA